MDTLHCICMEYLFHKVISILSLWSSTYVYLVSVIMWCCCRLFQDWFFIYQRLFFFLCWLILHMVINGGLFRIYIIIALLSSILSSWALFKAFKDCLLFSVLCIRICIKAWLFFFSLFIIFVGNCFNWPMLFA